MKNTLRGVGLGLRPSHYRDVLTGAPDVPWFEATSENHVGGRPREILRQVRARYPVALHGVSMNLGGTDPLNLPFLKNLKALADEIDPAFVSDHLCWTGAGGTNLHDLLPLPYTEEALAHVARRVEKAQDVLGRRLLVENVSSYLTYAADEMTEWAFLAALTRRTGCGLLLDVNNIHVSAANHGFDGRDYLKGIPRGAVGYMHLAGYSVNDGILIDTHDHAVWPPVWKLFREAVGRFDDVPAMIEWDDRVPSFARLRREARTAEKVRREALDAVPA
jgi:uncharacterized protein (UPF0276 family)